MKMQNPYNLEVYKMSYELSKDVILEIENIKGKFRLQEQLLGAITSIPANLMEFCSMNKPAQQSEKLRTCIGEAFEAEYWLNLCKDLELIEKTKCEQFLERLIEVRKKLFSLRDSVKDRED